VDNQRQDVSARDHSQEGRQGARYFSVVENRRVSGGRVLQRNR
jgi:hypothetical protein